VAVSIGEEQNEIKQYLDAQYIGACEAVWRLLIMNMYGKDPNVIRLQLHLLGMHRVVFNTMHDPQIVLNRGEVQRTKLTKFFRMCAVDENARRFMYQKIPNIMFGKNKKKYGRSVREALPLTCCILQALLKVKAFICKLLLTVVARPHSFEDLRTVDGVIYGTFKDACNAMGLLQGNGEWIQCLEEAVAIRTGTFLHNLFVLIHLELQGPWKTIVFHMFSAA
jgi:hypothetical protein